jgi:hypothetical protein
MAVALVLSSAAFANGLTCAHGSTSCNSGKLGGGTLPFTGLDLAGVAAIGGLLLVAGFTLQRVSRRRG